MKKRAQKVLLVGKKELTTEQANCLNGEKGAIEIVKNAESEKLWDEIVTLMQKYNCEDLIIVADCKKHIHTFYV